MKTRQEAFDVMVNHLLTQKCKSIGYSDVTGKDLCLYRGPNGTKCAVGALIPDEAYRSDMEDMSVFSKRVVEGISNGGYKVGKKELGFYREVQEIHDYAPPEDWSDRLQGLAEENRMVFNYSE